MDYKEEYEAMVQRARELHEAGNFLTKKQMEIVCPELAESEDERIRMKIIEHLEMIKEGSVICAIDTSEEIAWLEKQKENPKSADSIPADCVSDAKCVDRWYKVGDFLPDNGRDVLAKDALSNYLIAHYDGDQWFISGYDNEDKPIVYTPAIKEWCNIPPERQKEQKPAEWSEEDEDMLNSCISSIEEAKENRYAYKENDGDTSYDREINWLKSLRPSWKPSEEQMSMLLAVIRDPNNAGSESCALAFKSLYEDLKKL